jgi:hypothetical protein
LSAQQQGTALARGKGGPDHRRLRREPTRKKAAGEDLIRAVFGNGAIAEDPVL